MPEIINVNNTDLVVKTWKNQRVVTFKDIDEVHERPEGTARRNFNENQNRFILGEDYFFLKPEDFENTEMYEIRTSEIEGKNSSETSNSLMDEIRTSINKGDVNNRGTIFLTESGYLMLVKSLNDDKAWEVQRTLVNTYFRAKEIFAITEQQYNTLLDNYNTLAKKMSELSTIINEQAKIIEDHHLELTARMDSYDFGSTRFDPERADFIHDMSEKLKEMMPYFDYHGNNYGDMLSDVIRVMDRYTEGGKFNDWAAKYKDSKHIDTLVNRLDVIAEYDELKENFLSAYNWMCRKNGIYNRSNNMLNQMFESRTFESLDDF